MAMAMTMTLTLTLALALALAHVTGAACQASGPLERDLLPTP
jgi:hypothetical protein